MAKSEELSWEELAEITVDEYRKAGILERPSFDESRRARKALEIAWNEVADWEASRRQNVA